MEQKSIESLWQRTRSSIESLNPLIESEAGLTDQEKNRLYPLCLSQYNFIGDNFPFFMSFHDSGGNDLQHYHDFFEINYVLKGQPIGVIDNHEITLQAGSLYIMNPNAVHYFKSYDDRTELILNIVLPVETFQKQIYQLLLSDPLMNAFFIRYKLEHSQQPAFIYLEQIDTLAKQTIDMLANEYLNKQQYSLVVIESLLTLLFSYILRSYNTSIKTINNPVSDVLDYMYQHYQTCTLDNLARVFNYHPKYLSSLIHTHTGQSYRHLMTMIRLQNSQYYLLYTNHTIDHIAATVGYMEKSSFYSSFKKHFNESPGEFRKAHSTHLGPDH